MEQFTIVATEYGWKITSLNENCTVFLYSSPIRVRNSIMGCFDDFIETTRDWGFVGSAYSTLPVNIKRIDRTNEFLGDDLPTSDRGTAIEYLFNTTHHSNEYATKIYSYETLVMGIAHRYLVDYDKIEAKAKEQGLTKGTIEYSDFCNSIEDSYTHYANIMVINCDYIGYSRTTTKLLKYCYEHSRMNYALEKCFGTFEEFVKMIKRVL